MIGPLHMGHRARELAHSKQKTAWSQGEKTTPTSLSRQTLHVYLELSCDGLAGGLKVENACKNLFLIQYNCFLSLDK